MTTRLLTPRRRALLTGAGLATVVAVGAAACGGSSSGGQPADAVSPSAPASASASALTVGTAHGGGGPPAGAVSPPAPASASASALTGGTAHGGGGTYLVDAKGRTLYLFEADTSTTSTCAGPCASQWPPALTSGAPTATADAKAGR